MQTIEGSRILAPVVCASTAPKVSSTSNTHHPDLHGRHHGKGMRRPILGLACLATLLTGVVAAQSPIAYVYVAQTDPASSQPYYNQPIYAYAADSSGKLTPVQGSPFTQVSGQMVGTSGSHFITRGRDDGMQSGLIPLNYLFSYDVAPNGAIEQQVSAIDTQSYGGSDCTSGNGDRWPDGAELDHTGKYVYVPFCESAIQTYKISSSGDLTFQNVTTLTNPDQTVGGLPKLTGNNAFGYYQTIANTDATHGPNGAFDALARQSDGSLQDIGIPTVTGPTLPDNYFWSFDGVLSNDPANHLAVMLGMRKFTPPSTIANEGCALASFTVGNQGQLTSTNTFDNMPPVCGQSMLLSPSGKVLVVLPYNGTSLQFFHFNGAQPITAFTAVKGSSGWFTKLAWDSSNHLYALNGLSGRLHVYTVSSSSVVEAPGSPYDLPFCGYDSQDGVENCTQTLVVHTVQSCSAPSSDGVHVCSPGNGGTVASPVSVSAAATLTGGLYRFELWANGTKLLTERNSGTMDQSVSMNPGSYHLVFDARDAAGNHQYAARDITVK